ncbi:Superoxide dismutase (Cu-Zn) precursor [Sphingomonas sp. AX6]|nr:Superoxide dismutase (Cu-Zn) precursor [Sphingomonas sp. AX6]
MRALASATALAASLALLSACSSEPANDTVTADNMLDNMLAEMPAEGGATTVTAQIRTADGTQVGTANAVEADGAIQVTVNGTGMPPGERGFHIHQVGACDGPDFQTAGGHWNPTNAQHGTDNPNGPHAGDMPNLTVAADGTASTSFTLPAGSFAGLMDGDGSAIVVHEGPDDMRTDPSGDSGARIACGIFAAG